MDHGRCIDREIIITSELNYCKSDLKDKHAY